jgi:hypothetical protein
VSIVLPTARRLKAVVEKLVCAPITVTRFTEADNGKWSYRYIVV